MMILKKKLINYYKNEYVTANNFLCVAAILENILINIGKKDLNQFQIAELIGLNIPASEKNNIITKNVTITKDENKCGMVFDDYGLNSFFKANNINLKEEYYPINTMEDWEFEQKLIFEISNKESFLIVGYNYSVLFKEQLAQYGHVSLVLGIDKHIPETLIFDPGPKNVGTKIVNTYDLYSAIKAKKDGIWVIRHN